MLANSVMDMAIDFALALFFLKGNPTFVITVNLYQSIKKVNRMANV